MKNILIISTSKRLNSNSDILSNQFIKGAIEVGNQVQKISLSNQEILFCKGCLACQKSGTCMIKDDAHEIINQMNQADVIVYATPVYFYAMSGQMKTLLDRSNPLFTADYKFRDIYLIMSAADEENEAFDGTIQGLQGWIDCFDKCSLKGILRGSGMTHPNDVKVMNKVMEEAYLLGKSIA